MLRKRAWSWGVLLTFAWLGVSQAGCAGINTNVAGVNTNVAGAFAQAGSFGAPSDQGGAATDPTTECPPNTTWDGEQCGATASKDCPSNMHFDAAKGCVWDWEKGVADLPPPDDFAGAPAAGTSPLVWIGLAATLASAGFGTATGVMSANLVSTLEEKCPDYVCEPEHSSDVNEMLVLGYASTVGFVAAGAGVALIIVGIAQSTSSGDKKSTSYPVLSPTGLGGRF